MTQNAPVFATIADALSYAIQKLTEATVDTPRLDAQLLLAWTLKCRREDLAREPERELTGREQLIFEKAVALRTERRPLPYITGESWFYGRPFKINRAVLIPRPETELLVEAALRICQNQPVLRLADIGTGSGCLAVTLACELPSAQVWATDLSGDALKLARKNLTRHGVSERVTLLQGDLLAPLPGGEKLDLVVSNPPYVTVADWGHLQPEVRDYEPSLALIGEDGAVGPGGTSLHSRLLSQARAYLRPGASLLMEVGQGQAESVADAMRTTGYTEVAIQQDMAGIGRVVMGRWEIN